MKGCVAKRFVRVLVLVVGHAPILGVLWKPFGKQRGLLARDATTVEASIRDAIDAVASVFTDIAPVFTLVEALG